MKLGRTGEHQERREEGKKVRPLQSPLWDALESLFWVGSACSWFWGACLDWAYKCNQTEPLEASESARLRSDRLSRLKAKNSKSLGDGFDFLADGPCQFLSDSRFLATLGSLVSHLGTTVLSFWKDEELRENEQVKVCQKPLWATKREISRFSKNRSQPTLKPVLPTIWKTESPSKPNYEPNLEFTARMRWHGTKKVGTWDGTNLVRLLL